MKSDNLDDLKYNPMRAENGEGAIILDFSENLTKESKERVLRRGNELLEKLTSYELEESDIEILRKMVLSWEKSLVEKEISKLVDKLIDKMNMEKNKDKIAKYYGCSSEEIYIGNVCLNDPLGELKCSEEELKKFKVIFGDVNLFFSKIESLGQVENIVGDVTFGNYTKDTGNLESVGGSAKFDNSKITSTGKIKSIGEDADFRYSQVADIPNLQHVGGSFLDNEHHLKKQYKTNRKNKSAIEKSLTEDENLFENVRTGDIQQALQSFKSKIKSIFSDKNIDDD